MISKKLSLAAAALLLAVGSAAPASAALVLGATACAGSDITPGASACRGWYTGNLNGGSPTMKADSATALNSLLGVGTFTGPTLTWLEDFAIAGNSVNFATALYGQTVVSFHVGGAVGQATGVGYTASAFYLFDAGNLVGGLDLLGFNRAGLSNARLYSTGRYVPPPPPAVPEPATWALLVLGFGLVGRSLRQRARQGMTSFA